MKLTFRKNYFEISDNCGGIGYKDAKNEVFRFGRVAHKTESSLSVYGIGLKRAIFKLGKRIEITSKTTTDGFIVAIDVDDWLKSDNAESNGAKAWYFPLEKCHAAKTPEEAGTRIVVNDLNPQIITRIKEGTLEKSLERIIGTAYSLFLHKYVRITVNDFDVRPAKLPVGLSEAVTPSHDSFKIDNVHVSIIAGIAERSGTDWGSDKAGWYVLCNGRVVVFADKTELTEWGPLLPTFQPKFRPFLGLALFFSRQPEKLPWTTTKRGLDKDSEIYQQARHRMVAAARPVLNFLNSMYQSEEYQEPREREIASHVKAGDLSTIARSPKSSFSVEPPMKESKSHTISVQFRTEKENIERAKRCLKKRNWSAGRIGRHALEYFLKKECPE